jgi:hypothetical protein
MILQATPDLGPDPAHCAILGDKMSDIEAGAELVLRILVGSRDALREKHAPSHEVVADLAEALLLLRSHFSAGCV